MRRASLPVRPYARFHVWERTMRTSRLNAVRSPSQVPNAQPEMCAATDPFSGSGEDCRRGSTSSDGKLAGSRQHWSDAFANLLQESHSTRRQIEQFQSFEESNDVDARPCAHSFRHFEVHLFTSEGGAFTAIYLNSNLYTKSADTSVIIIRKILDKFQKKNTSCLFDRRVDEYHFHALI